MASNVQADFDECFHHIGPAGADVNLTCTSKLMGRYLYITVMTSEPHILTMCDVRVYGDLFSKYTNKQI